MKEIKSWRAETEEDTIAIAEELAQYFKPNDVVLFDGDLGSGKTFMVKALCRIWQTSDEAVSPTFAIVHQYRGPQPVNHLDLYRIERDEELDNLGWEEFLEMDAVTFIEWPQRIEPRLSSYYKIEIRIKNGKRRFTLYST